MKSFITIIRIDVKILRVLFILNEIIHYNYKDYKDGCQNVKDFICVTNAHESLKKKFIKCVEKCFNDD